MSYPAEKLLSVIRGNNFPSTVSSTNTALQFYKHAVLRGGASRDIFLYTMFDLGLIVLSPGSSK